MILSMIKGKMKSFIQLTSSGKSGSFFFFSSDGKFVLKTIKKKEKRFLKEILKNYFTHLRENPGSLIMKIFGLHQIRITKIGSKKKDKRIYFIIMKNAFDSTVSIDVRYDLKGSLHKRETNGNNDSIARKDLNFLDDKVKIQLQSSDKRYLLQVL